MDKTNICKYRMKTQGVVLCTLCSTLCKNVPKKLCIMAAEYWEENKKLAEAMKPKEEDMSTHVEPVLELMHGVNND